MELIIENVRSLFESHTVPIRPLTLLVGENSTGKTTFLSMLSAVSDLGFPSPKGSLYAPPYDLGSFDTIASYKGGRFGRAQTFKLGFSTIEKEQNIKIIASYNDSHGQPVLCNLTVDHYNFSLNVDFSNGNVSGDVIFHSVKKSERKRLQFEGDLPSSADYSFQTIPNILFHTIERSRSRGIRKDRTLDLIFPMLDNLYEMSYKYTKRVKSIAPIRTKPRRTYDDISDDFSPEGDHIPVLLARLLAKEEQDSTAQSLHNVLIEFGKESGLFRDIEPRRLGKKQSSPFQIMVKIAGPANNLSDVGYGVSQSLPVVVESIIASKEQRLLLQQPEVHLHPRAQSALASFFAKLVATGNKQFVLETHSDFIVDRIRQEVARGLLSPKDVILLFFSKEGPETTIYPIALDNKGNILNAPPIYRNFFLKEELNLITTAGTDVSYS